MMAAAQDFIINYHYQSVDYFLSNQLVFLVHKKSENDFEKSITNVITNE